MKNNLPKTFYVHVQISWAGRPLFCDACNDELWEPGKTSSSSFWCDVDNYTEHIFVSQLICEKCMKKFKAYPDVVILEKSEVPDEILRVINEAIASSLMGIFQGDENKVSITYFDYNTMEVDSGDEDPFTAQLLISGLKSKAQNMGMVVEAI